MSCLSDLLNSHKHRMPVAIATPATSQTGLSRPGDGHTAKDGYRSPPTLAEAKLSSNSVSVPSGHAPPPSQLQLEPVSVAGQRTYDGKVFPLVLAVPASDPTPNLEDAAVYLQTLGGSGELNKLLNDHGAVLFRGFGHASPETFSKLVRAAEEQGGRGSSPFEQIGLAGKRNSLAPEVFTANEGPPDRRFYQHNEVGLLSLFLPADWDTTLPHC